MKNKTLSVECPYCGASLGIQTQARFENIGIVGGGTVLVNVGLIESVFLNETEHKDYGRKRDLRVVVGGRKHSWDAWEPDSKKMFDDLKEEHDRLQDMLRKK